VAALSRSIDRISGFIYDILRLAKLDMTPNFSGHASFNLSALLAELAENFIIIIRGQGIKIDAHIEPGIAITGNRHEIEEMITNVISNSVKFVGNKEDKMISLTLSGQNGWARICVTDNGTGINADLLSELNKSFSDRQYNPNYKYGCGLGLAICKKIIDRHQGTISITSRCGEDTKVTMSLPIKN
jgi:signal transduction histidine kinase